MSIASPKGSPLYPPSILQRGSPTDLSLSNDDKSDFLKSKRLFKTDIFVLYNTYYKFCFYLFIIPFKIEEDVSEGITFKTYRLHQVICVGLHICRFLYQIPSSVSSLTGSNFGHNPSQFYQILATITGFMLVMSFSIVSLRKSRLQAMLRHSYASHGDSESSDLSRGSRVAVKKRTTYSILALSFGIIVVYIGREFSAGFDIKSWTQFLNSGSQAFFDHLKIKTRIYSEAEAYNMSPFECIYCFITTTVHILLICFDYTLVILLEILVFVCCKAVCHVGYDFGRAVAGTSPITLEQLISCYGEMKNLIDDINVTFGGQILSFMLAAVPYYGLYLVMVFDEGDWPKKIEIIYFLFLYGAALSLAAEGHRKIQEFPEYLFQNYNTFSANYEDLSVFISQITTSQIGLQGFGFFTISYGFLGTALGIVLTHVIIMLQFTATKQ